MASPRDAAPPVAAYVVAVAVVAAALLVRLAINSWLGPTVPYLQFFPAIMLASWYGGFRPGVVAALLSAIAAYAWFLPPFGAFKLLAVVDATSLVLFVLIGLGIAYLSGSTKQAEAAQRQVADQWRTTLASIGDAVIVTDATGRVTFLNRVAEELTGWDTASAVNRPLDEVFVTANEATQADHSVLKHRDGRWFPIAESSAPIRGRTDRVDGIVRVFRDLTAEREAALALRRSQGLLEAIAENSEAVIYAKDPRGQRLDRATRFVAMPAASSSDTRNAAPCNSPS